MVTVSQAPKCERERDDRVSLKEQGAMFSEIMVLSYSFVVNYSKVDTMP